MIISLFSGAGGLDWGFHQEGVPLAGANDIKADAAETYSANMGVPIRYGRELGGGQYTVWDVSETFIGRIPETPSLLLGGPPCQDFSVMRGPDDERRGALTLRGRLYLHFGRYLAVVKPLAFVFENVPGLLSSNSGRDIQAVLEDLSNPAQLAEKWIRQHRLDGENTPPPPEDLLEAGGVPSYRIAMHLVDMAKHGVPQRRRRLILVGLQRDVFGEKVVDEIKSFLEGDPLLERYPLTAMEALEGKVLTELDGVYKEIRNQYNMSFGSGAVLDDYLRAVEEQNPSHLFRIRSGEFEEAMERHKEILQMMGWYGTSLSEVREEAFEDGTHLRPRESQSVLERMRQILPGQNHVAVRGTQYEVEGRGFSLVYRRLDPLKPAYTVVAHGGGGTWGYHYRRDRSKLTNRERARLQGFPDAFVFRGSQAQIRAQIGEAVPPIFSLRLAKFLINMLNEVGATARELARAE